MRIVARKPHRLAARWCHREKDLIVDCSPRFGNANLHWLSSLFSKEVLAELQKRGFDLSTLVFHIDKTPQAIAEHEKMAGRGPVRPTLTKSDNQVR